MIENNHATGNLSKMVRFYSTILWRNIRRGKLSYKAHLILTWKCQARCAMCEIWKRKSSDDLTLEEWQILKGSVLFSNIPCFHNHTEDLLR